MENMYQRLMEKHSMSLTLLRKKSLHMLAKRKRKISNWLWKLLEKHSMMVNGPKWKRLHVRVCFISSQIFWRKIVKSLRNSNHLITVSHIKLH